MPQPKRLVETDSARRFLLLHLATFANITHAIALANDSLYGPAAVVCPAA